MKFKIIPINQAIVVEGEDANDALENFATNMDMDMHIYFRAVPLNEQPRIYPVIVTHKDGRYIVSSLDIPGCSAEGDSLSSALTKATEKAERIVRLMPKMPEPSTIKCLEDLITPMQSAEFIVVRDGE